LYAGAAAAALTRGTADGGVRRHESSSARALVPCAHARPRCPGTVLALSRARHARRTRTSETPMVPRLAVGCASDFSLSILHRLYGSQRGVSPETRRSKYAHRHAQRAGTARQLSRARRISTATTSAPSDDL